MELFQTSSVNVITEKAKMLYREERENHKILNGWFLSREIAADAAEVTPISAPPSSARMPKGLPTPSPLKNASSSLSPILLANSEVK